MTLTLQQFRNAGWQSLLDLSDWWILVTDTETCAPLFDIKRGSLFVFGNVTLPRLGFGEFKTTPLEDKLDFLARGVCVLTVEDEDTFLVRLAE